MIKRGSKVRVVKMDTAGGMDWQAKRLEGKVFTVRHRFRRTDTPRRNRHRTHPWCR